MIGTVKFYNARDMYGYIAVEGERDFKFTHENLPRAYTPRKGDTVMFTGTRTGSTWGAIAKTDKPVSSYKQAALSLTIIHFDEHRYEWMKWQAGKWSALDICKGMPRVGIHTSSVNGKVLAVITPAMWRGDDNEE